MEEGTRGMRMLKVSEVQSILQLGRTKTYELLKSPNCPFRVVHFGSQIRVPAKALYEWLGDHSSTQIIVSTKDND